MSVEHRYLQYSALEEQHVCKSDTASSIVPSRQGRQTLF